MPKLIPSLAGAALLALAAQAQAAVPHTVQPGETLWGIALQSNLTTRALAAYNGLHEEAYAIAGSTIYVPTEAEAAAALTAVPATATTDTPVPVPDASSSHVVQPGETLSGLAAQVGISTEDLALANGLDPEAWLIEGTTITVGSAPPAQSTEPVAVSGDEPIPTQETVSSDTVATIAADHGLDPAFATALAYNESGFNNSLVSSADARGVMQILPSTWDWINTNLAGYELDPASAHENVHAGVMYLNHLLGQTGGDQGLAAASYFQGWESVRNDGLFPETQQYVDTVMALKPQFGG
jgi:LysM repeat protein